MPNSSIIDDIERCPLCGKYIYNLGDGFYACQNYNPNSKYHCDYYRRDPVYTPSLDIAINNIRIKSLKDGI